MDPNIHASRFEAISQEILGKDKPKSEPKPEPKKRLTATDIVKETLVNVAQGAAPRGSVGTGAIGDSGPVGITGPSGEKILDSVYLENHVGTSNKFYLSEIVETPDVRYIHRTTYGRIGSTPTFRQKDFRIAWEARSAHEKIVRQKLYQHGYVLRRLLHMGP